MSEENHVKLLQKSLKIKWFNLYDSEKKRTGIIREYYLTPSTFDEWVKQANTSGIFLKK